MVIMLNGQKKSIEDGPPFGQLLSLLYIQPPTVIVERNLKIVEEKISRKPSFSPTTASRSSVSSAADDPDDDHILGSRTRLTLTMQDLEAILGEMRIERECLSDSKSQHHAERCRIVEE